MNSVKADSATIPAAVVIPALNPDDTLPTLVEQLEDEGFERFIVVDDGSGAGYRPVFDVLRARENCTVLTHAHNCGKGRALKTAFSFYRSHPDLFQGCRGVVTLDADGQHRAKDAARCAAAMCAHPGQLVLGCRRFTGGRIPARSRAGNIITRRVFRLLYGLDISDTQTGLRAVCDELIAVFEPVRGEAFDYEMNMLVKLSERAQTPIEVPIETIYTPRNESSHFHPVLDSLRIYAVFLRFLASSLAAFAADIALFTVLNSLLRHAYPVFSVALATVGARAASSVLNFLLNKNVVFHGDGSTRTCLGRYYLLCAGQTICSAVLVSLLAGLTGAPSGAISFVKAAVDTALFLLSYRIQRRWVFHADGKSRFGA